MQKRPTLTNKTANRAKYRTAGTRLDRQAATKPNKSAIILTNYKWHTRKINYD